MRLQYVEQEIINIYGKSIRDMTAQELKKYKLIEIWEILADLEDKDEKERRQA